MRESAGAGPEQNKRGGATMESILTVIRFLSRSMIILH